MTMNMELSGRGKPSPEKAQRALARANMDHAGVEIGLNAAIVAVKDNEPVVLVVKSDPDSVGSTDGLPFGPFSPRDHRTLEGGLRSWVRDQTGLELG